jgi:hypothetical protein
MPRLSRIVVSAVVATLSLAGGVAAAGPPSPVTIETEISFASFPFSGTFTVTEGAGALGCTGGTFVDMPRSGGLGQIEKQFACTSGAGAGEDFLVLFKNDCTFLSHGTFQCRPGAGYLGQGQWMILSGTGALDGVHGSGDFVVVRTDDTGEETLTGQIVREP